MKEGGEVGGARASDGFCGALAAVHEGSPGHEPLCIGVLRGASRFARGLGRSQPGGRARTGASDGSATVEEEDGAQLVEGPFDLVVQL
eukprot:3122839-Prymnesium_polylepis.3